MTTHSHFEKRDIEVEILAYLYDNPDAQDTLEGIVQWWLLERYIRRQYDIVRQALSDLINQDLIIEVRELTTSIRYRVNTDKLKEIKNILNKSCI
jgi:hypothetical protein